MANKASQVFVITTRSQTAPHMQIMVSRYTNAWQQQEPEREQQQMRESRARDVDCESKAAVLKKRLMEHSKKALQRQELLKETRRKQAAVLKERLMNSRRKAARQQQEPEREQPQRRESRARYLDCESQAALLKERLMEHSKKAQRRQKLLMASRRKTAALLKERLMNSRRKEARQQQESELEQRLMKEYRAEDLEWCPEGDMEWPTVESIQGRAKDFFHWGVPPVHRWHPPLSLSLVHAKPVNIPYEASSSS